jgi:hypothetical protein
MKYWLTAVLFSMISTSHSYAQTPAGKSSLSIYENNVPDTGDVATHVIAFDLVDRIVASASSREQANDFVAAIKVVRRDRADKDPPNVRKWSQDGVCGVQADEMTFAVPPAGKRSVD